MVWNVELDEDFAAEFEAVDASVQIAAVAHIELLRKIGPRLGRPHADTVKGSKFPNMKELRFQVSGFPWRFLFAFDPERNAILLTGGGKSNDKRFYDTHIPIADARYQRHLDSLSKANKRS